MARKDKNQEVQEVQEDQIPTEEANAAAEVDAAIRTSFDTSVAEGASEDDVKMAMIAGGASFKNVTRLYNQFMIDAGFAISKEDRDNAVAESLTGRDLETEEGFVEGTAAVMAGVKGATEKSAAALVRGYAKKNELPCYVKPKGEGAGRSGFASTFYTFLTEASRTVDEATAFVMGTDGNAETSANVQKHKSHYLALHKMAEDIRSK